MTQHKIEIKLATQPRHFSEARELILDYVAWLGMDLSFQNFDKEMNALAAMYNERDGGLYIAYLDDKAVGVAGLRRFNDTESEVKRMFVNPASRGFGIGKLLLEKCIETARGLDYRTVKLDTADFMKAAIKLYTDHGFVEIPPYRFNPHEQARYFELDLTR